MNEANFPGYVPPPHPNKYAEAIRSEREKWQIISPLAMDAAMKLFERGGAARSEFLKLARGIGRAAEPYDGTIERYVNDNNEVEIAVSRGMVFGALVVPVLHGNTFALGDVRRELPINIKVVRNEVHIDTKKDDDEEESEPETSLDAQRRRASILHQAGQDVLNYGGTGLILLNPAAEEELETTEMKAVHEVNHQIRFRQGFGIVALAAHRMHHRYNLQKKEEDLKNMENLLGNMTEDDWDISKL